MLSLWPNQARVCLSLSHGRNWRREDLHPFGKFDYCRLLVEVCCAVRLTLRSCLFEQVNKTGLSLRVIDGKSFKGSFTQKELEGMELNDTWAQCDRCEKWRMLHGQDEQDLPGE